MSFLHIVPTFLSSCTAHILIGDRSCLSLSGENRILHLKLSKTTDAGEVVGQEEALLNSLLVIQSLWKSIGSFLKNLK